MAADWILEAVDVTADCVAASIRLWKMGSSARGLEERLDHGVVENGSLARRRDREMPFFLSSAWYSMEQYWLPRSAW